MADASHLRWGLCLGCPNERLLGGIVGFFESLRIHLGCFRLCGHRGLEHSRGLKFENLGLGVVPEGPPRKPALFNLQCHIRMYF